MHLIVGKNVSEAREILRFCERGAAEPVMKVLDSAVANAEHNDNMPEDELFVARAFADEGPTMKRGRPRARGRYGRLKKRSSHLTIVVARYSDDELEQRRRREAQTGAPARQSRSRRVSASRRRAEAEEHDRRQERARPRPRPRSRPRSRSRPRGRRVAGRRARDRSRRRRRRRRRGGRRGRGRRRRRRRGRHRHIRRGRRRRGADEDASEEPKGSDGEDTK